MKITPDTITTDFLVRIHDEALAAVLQIRQISLLADSGEIGPAEASKRLAEALAPLQINNARYFRSKVNGAIRRYGFGVDAFRYADQNEWFGSNGITMQELDEFWEEVSSEEGEP